MGDSRIWTDTKMNTQIILIIIAIIAAFIAGIIIGSIFRNKPLKTETVKIETVKNISLSKIISFITEKLTEDEEIEIIEAAEKNPEIAISITKNTKYFHDMHRKIKSGFKYKENWNSILLSLYKKEKYCISVPES